LGKIQLTKIIAQPKSEEVIGEENSSDFFCNLPRADGNFVQFSGPGVKLGFEVRF